MNDPNLYDVEAALREVAKNRRRRDEGTRAMIQLGDRLAAHMDAHFGPEAIETVGLALISGAGALGALAEPGVSAMALVNVMAFAGQRLVGDARAAEGDSGREPSTLRQGSDTSLPDGTDGSTP